MVCVCGHPPADHSTVIMSVPLTRTHPPFYDLGPQLNSIARTYPNATYCREECWCGCAEYLDD